MTAGWEAFEALDHEGTFTRTGPIVRPREVRYPPPEVTDGVGCLSIKIEVYGDDVEQAFVHVIGTDRDKVVEVFRRAELLVKRELLTVVMVGET